ncbi:MAG: PIN domain-containing protein [Planctomycetaceae bacterium]|nr:PIN domain-containing protein [Planctomycetaceae bacterium]
MTSLRTAGHSLALVPQVFYELWSVLTRPAANNGLGFSIEQSLEDRRRILDSSELFEDDSGVFAAWRDLVAKHGVLGKRAHDARLIAAMVRYGIGHLMTFNELTSLVSSRLPSSRCLRQRPFRLPADNLDCRDSHLGSPRATMLRAARRFAHFLPFQLCELGKIAGASLSESRRFHEVVAQVGRWSASGPRFAFLVGQNQPAPVGENSYTADDGQTPLTHASGRRPKHARHCRPGSSRHEKSRTARLGR